MIERRKLERWTKAETADQDEARDTQRAIRDELESGDLEGVSDGLEFTPTSKARIETRLWYMIREMSTSW
jgi:hypothetical protein